MTLNLCDDLAMLCLHPRLILCANMPHSDGADNKSGGHTDDKEKQQADGHSFAEARAPTESSQNHSQQPSYDAEANCEVSMTEGVDDEWNEDSREQQSKCDDS